MSGGGTPTDPTDPTPRLFALITMLAENAHDLAVCGQGHVVGPNHHARHVLANGLEETATDMAAMARTIRVLNGHLDPEADDDGD